MKTKLNIKNFRIFDEKGVTFEINPITILTGANSSGKSSMVKAVFLLNSFLSQIKSDLDKGEEVKLDKYKLDFSTYPNNLLGRFDKVVHNGSKSKTVTFEYTVYSLILSKDVTVRLVFSADENDELNNAYLEKISFSTKEGVFYSCDKEGTYSHGFSGLKDAFLEYLPLEADVYALSKAWNDYNLNSSKDNNQTVGKLIDKLSSVNQSRYRDALNYVRSKTKNGKENRPIAPQELVESVVESDSMFRVPVLDVLSRVSKSEIQSFVELNYLNDWVGYGLYFASHVVIDDFVNSRFDDFKSYYEDFEKRFLSSCVVPSKNQYSDFTPDYFLRKHYSKIHLPKHNDFDLFNNHLMFISTDYFEDNFGSYVEDAKLKALLKEGFKEWENVPATFELVYSCVMAWNDEFSKDNNESYVFSYDEFGYTVYHTVFKAFAFLMEDLVSETICPDWRENVSYVGSTRVNIKRLYSLEDNDDFTKLLKKYFESKRSFLICQKEIADDHVKKNEKRDYVPDSFINRWIEKFGIGKSISFDVDREGIGVQIRLHKTSNDEGRLLADEGYGITQLVSVLLQIETAIISAKGIKVKSPGVPNNVDDYDYRVFRYEPQTIAIEEPEIHLHPKYQSLLADMFLEAYEKYNIHFIIETHSEYLIRKTQVFVSQAKYKSKRAMNEKNPFKVFYVPEGGEPYDLEFLPDGRFKNEFGKGFFDEAANLAFEIL